MNRKYRTLALAFCLVVAMAVPALSQSHRMVKAPPQSLKQSVDFKSKLPVAVFGILDRVFPNWTFKTDNIEYQNGSDPLLVCQLNLDTVPDYALHILSIAVDDTTEKFVALVSTGSSYGFFTLQSLRRTDPLFGTYYQEVFRHGTDFDTAPFAEDGDDRTSFPTDCIAISISNANSCSVYLFDRGEFKPFSPCE